MPPIYKELYTFWDTCFDKDIYSGLYTVQGLGISWISRIYAQERNIRYINSPNLEVTDPTIFDINSGDKNILHEYEKYFSSCQRTVPPIRACFIFDAPTKDHNFSLLRHIHKKKYMRVRTKEETKILIKELKQSFNPSQLSKIYELSGGIPRIVKYLSLHQDLISKTQDEILNDTTLSRYVEGIFHSANQYTSEVNKKMGIQDKVSYRSKLIQTWADKNKSPPEIDIAINTDRHFRENGVRSDNQLTPTEFKILKFLIENNTISRDKISELKWGENEIEKYSYWAVSKTIERLNDKLDKYLIEPIYKYGYKLCPK